MTDLFRLDLQIDLMKIPFDERVEFLWALSSKLNKVIFEDESLEDKRYVLSTGIQDLEMSESGLCVHNITHEPEHNNGLHGEQNRTASLSDN